MKTFINEKYKINDNSYLDHILTDDDIMEFFKIIFCNEYLKAIFENYA